MESEDIDENNDWANSSASNSGESSTFIRYALKTKRRSMLGSSFKNFNLNTSCSDSEESGLSYNSMGVSEDAMSSTSSATFASVSELESQMMDLIHGYHSAQTSSEQQAYANRLYFANSSERSALNKMGYYKSYEMSIENSVVNSFSGNYSMEEFQAKFKELEENNDEDSGLSSSDTDDEDPVSHITIKAKKLRLT